jgi:hypothetical protein
MVATRSVIFAVDNMYSQPRATVVSSFVVEGEVDLSMFRETARRKVLEAKNPDGSLIRPEMTQYISQWMGFYFWKKDPKFVIQNHFRFYDGPSRRSSYTTLEFYGISNELLGKPYTKDQSPWEVLFFPNCIDEEKGRSGTGISFRVHHALADGFSILKTFATITTTKGQFLPEPKKTKPKSIFQIFRNVLELIFLAPYETNKVFLYINFDRNAWHIPESKLSNKVNGSAFEKIPLSYIKEIKNLGGCSFSSVLYAAFAGGIRNIMLEQGIKVPEAIHCCTPLPIIGHPDKLRNIA